MREHTTERGLPRPAHGRQAHEQLPKGVWLSPSTLAPPRAKRKSRLGASGVLAQALLEQGQSLRSVQRQTGISQPTLIKLKRTAIIPREQVNSVKQSIQDQFALMADSALRSITKKKLKEADFTQLVNGAAKAAQMAGIGAPTVENHYNLVMNKYLDAPVQSSKQSEPITVNALHAENTDTHESSMNTEEKPSTT